MKSHGLPAGLIGSLLLLVAGSMLITGCEETEEPEELIPPDYDSWERTIDEDLNFQVPGHGETLRRIYINPLGEEVAITTSSSGTRRYEYPAGTLIVKEIYPSPESPPTADPVMITAMLKAPEDGRARGGWLWITKNLASGEERVLQEEYCLTCHENANEPYPYQDGNPNGEFRDYTFYPFRPEGE